MGFNSASRRLNFLSTSTQNDTRRRRYHLLRGWVIPHQLLHTDSTTCTLNMLAIAKYSCRVVSLTLGIQEIVRAVEWVCGHFCRDWRFESARVIDVSVSLSLSLSLLWVWVLSDKVFCAALVRKSYRMCTSECRRGQTNKE